jgi:hypothetical protein
VIAVTDHFNLKEFTRSETADKLKIDNTLPDALMPAMLFTACGMERIRHVLKYPMKITSGYRCDELNKAVGGVDDSQHKDAEACDFVCPVFGIPRDVVIRLLPMVKPLGIDQLILEGGWVHVSFTTRPRYEVLTLVKGKYVKGLA